LLSAFALAASAHRCRNALEGRGGVVHADQVRVAVTTVREEQDLPWCCAKSRRVDVLHLGVMTTPYSVSPERLESGRGDRGRAGCRPMRLVSRCGGGAAVAEGWVMGGGSVS